MDQQLHRCQESYVLHVLPHNHNAYHWRSVHYYMLLACFHSLDGLYYLEQPMVCGPPTRPRNQQDFLRNCFHYLTLCVHLLLHASLSPSIHPDEEFLPK